jgi:hypothetical protein
LLSALGPRPLNARPRGKEEKFDGHDLEIEHDVEGLVLPWGEVRLINSIVRDLKALDSGTVDAVMIKSLAETVLQAGPNFAGVVNIPKRLHDRVSILTCVVVFVWPSSCI